MTKNNSGASFMKKIFWALLLVSSIASTAWGQIVTAPININGGSTPGTGSADGIGTTIGSNGQIQIYRRNTAQTYYNPSLGAQPVQFDGSNPSDGIDNTNVDLLNGIFLSVGNPSTGQQDLFGPALNRSPLSGLRSSTSGGLRYVDWTFDSASPPVTIGGVTNATTTYTATSSGGCTYTLSAVWNYVKPRDYVTVTYNVALTTSCGSGDDGKEVRLYHLIDTYYTKGGVTNDTANPFELQTALCPQGAPTGVVCPTIGGASNQTKIVEAFRLRKDLCSSCTWDGFYTGISSTLFSGNKGGPANPGSSPFIPGKFIGGVDTTNGDHAMGMSWKVGTVSGGSLPPGQFIQDILFQDSQAVTQKNVGQINGVAYSGGVATDNNGVRSTTGQALSVGSTIQYLLRTTHNTWSGGPGGNALNVTLRDTVPAGTTYSGGAGEGWGCAPSNNAGSVCTKTISFLANDGLAKNTPFTVTVTSLPTSPAAIDNTLVADVCVGGNPCPPVPSDQPGNCLNGDPQQCRIVVPLVAVPQLTIKKSASGTFTSPQTAGAGGFYTFTVTNSGSVAYTDSFVLGEDLPPGFTYTGTPAITNTTNNDYTITCDTSNSSAPKCTVVPLVGKSLQPNTSITFKMPVNVAAGTTVSDATNYVSVVPCIGAACGNVTPPNCKTTPMPANCDKYTLPGLTIKKSASGTFTSPQTAGAGGFYTFTVTNSGSVAYSGSFVLTDTLPPGFTYPGTPPVKGKVGTAAANYTVSCDGNTVKPKCTVTPPAGAILGPNETLQFTMPVSVAAGTTVSDATNYVSVVPSPPGCVGAACGDVVDPDCKVTPMPANCDKYTLPGLTIKKSASGTFTAGQIAGGKGGVYTFTVSNYGRFPYKGSFDLNENLPSGFSYNNLTHPMKGPAGYTINCGTSTTQPVCTVTPPADIPVGTELQFTMPVDIAANTTVIDAVNIVSVTPPNPNGPDDPNNPNDPKKICTTDPLPQYCSKYVITLLPLVVTKVANKQRAEIGDTVLYTVTVTNSSPLIINDVSLVDILPAGFRYVAGTAQGGPGAVQSPVADPSGSPGPRLSFQVGRMTAGLTLTYSYRVRIGVGAQQGDGTNQVQAYVKNKPNSNIARVKVAIDDGVFTQDGCLIGKVFADCNGNGIQDPGEPNIPKVRLYMDDGTYFITDEAGKYSFCGIKPRTHVIKVDKTTLPPGAVMGITSNRNAHDPDSLFLDVKYGELIRGDFAVRSEPSGQLCVKPEPPVVPIVGVEKVPEPPKPYTTIEEITLSADALFDFDKWQTLKPAGKKSLDEFIGKLQRITYEMMSVTGHTDWVGTHAYNDKLAVRRANTVVAYLRSKNVDVKRMIIQGRGKREPIATNKTAAGRALNRRVNVVMVGKYTLIHNSGE